MSARTTEFVTEVHTLTDPSSDADATRRPSTDIAAEYTAPECPRNTLATRFLSRESSSELASDAIPRDRGTKMFIAKRKGNIHVDVRARGRAKRSAPRKAAGYTRVAPKSTKLLRHPNRQWHADTRAHRHSGTQTLAHDGTHGTVARRHSHTTAPTAQWHVDTRTQRHLRHSGT